VVDFLKPEFECENLHLYRPAAGGIYQSIRANENIQDPAETKEFGYLSAKFKRIASN
jgi:hypothetical protein